MDRDSREDKKSPLLPDRNEQGDFFVCDIFDAAPKGDMASMAHPVFSLLTKPDHRVREYKTPKGEFVKVKPSSDGLATIHDRDVLIYCISQIMAALNEGREVSQTVHIKAYDLLKSTNRLTDGRAYTALRSALSRLQGTQIETNIITGGKEQLDIFSIIDRARIVRETRDGRMQEIEVKLSDWVFNAIREKEVLTLNRDYFRLRKPLERRIYELGRKHCGRKNSWRIKLETLQDKCGSGSSLREFRRLVLNIVEQDQEYEHMPDYAILFEPENDMVVFINRGNIVDEPTPAIHVPALRPETFLEAKKCAPGWDVYTIEHEWREWLSEPPRDADKAFLGFCAKWFQKRGRPQ